MAKLCNLFSGSSGNAVFLAAGGTRLMVDAGVSTSRLRKAFEERGEELSALDGIFVTHSHTDHIAGLKVMLKSLPIPLYGSEETLSALANEDKIPPNAILRPIGKDEEIGGMLVSRFATPHDAPGSSGYVITCPNGEKVAVCTDLGHVTDEVRKALTGCRTVVIESNHDISMLEKGSYPPERKRRIAGELGHLSNAACATELPALAEAGAVRFILAHISRENNTPATAESSAVGRLLTAGLVRDEDYRLHIAAPEGNPVITL